MKQSLTNASHPQLPHGVRHEDWNWAQIRARCLVEARRLLRGHHDAEEAVQEALARAWRHQSACRTPDAPLPWCLQITRREALRLIGHGARRAEPLEPDALLSDERSLKESDRAIVRIDIDRALRALTADERILIGLRYDSGCSHPEIAERLGIPEATARVRLHRAQKRLKPLLR